MTSLICKYLLISKQFKIGIFQLIEGFFDILSLKIFFIIIFEILIVLEMRSNDNLVVGTS